MYETITNVNRRLNRRDFIFTTGSPIVGQKLAEYTVLVKNTRSWTHFCHNHALAHHWIAQNTPGKSQDYAAIALLQRVRCTTVQSYAEAHGCFSSRIPWLEHSSGVALYQATLLFLICRAMPVCSYCIRNAIFLTNPTTYSYIALFSQKPLPVGLP